MVREWQQCPPFFSLINLIIMKKKQQQPNLFEDNHQPDIFTNSRAAMSTLSHPTKPKRTMYYSIIWLNKANRHQPEIKTMLNEFDLEAWGRATLENFSMAMINASYEPTKHECKVEDGTKAWYWAEPNDIDNGKSYCIIFQAEGYLPTEGHDDWFGIYEQADEVAKYLANGGE